MSLRDVNLTAEQLAVRAGHMRGLLDHAGWRVLEAELEHMADQLRKDILAGGLDDYVTYRQYCGSLKMVTKILDLPEQFIAQAPKEGSPDE